MSAEFRSFCKSLSIEERLRVGKIAYRDAKIHASYGIIALILLITDLLGVGLDLSVVWRVAIFTAVISSLVNTLSFFRDAHELHQCAVNKF